MIDPSTTPDATEGEVDDISRLSGSELFERWQEENRVTNFENSTKNLTRVASVLGYRDIDEMLGDNPGAQQAVVEFLSGWCDRNPEWRDSLEEAVMSGPEPTGRY